MSRLYRMENGPNGNFGSRTDHAEEGEGLPIFTNLHSRAGLAPCEEGFPAEQIRRRQLPRVYRLAYFLTVRRQWRLWGADPNSTGSYQNMEVR